MMYRIFPLFLCVIMLLVFLPTLTAQEQPDSTLLPKKSDSQPETTNPIGAEATQSAALTDELTPTSTGFIVLALFLTGMIFMFLEIAVIPGFGVAGITGIAMITTGVALAFWKLSLNLAVAFSVAAVASLIAIIFGAIYIFPHTKMGEHLILTNTMSVGDPFPAIRDLEKYVGMQGVTTCDLRPSGIVRIGTERMDVLSDGEFIPKNTKIKIIKEKSGSLIVIPLEPEDESDTPA